MGDTVMRKVRITAITIAALLALIAGGAPTQATGYLVTKTADTMDGVCNADCSLREALYEANNIQGPHTIDLPGGGAVYQLTIPGNTDNAGLTGDLDISNDVEIFGDENPIIEINGQALGDRVIHVTGGTVMISGVTIRGGLQFGDDGGGILNQGSLAIWNSTVSSSGANRGGGIANWGTLTLQNSMVSSNFGFLGGGLFNGGSLSLNTSTVNGNIASGNGGGIYNDGGSITLTGSTVNGNEATYGGIGTGYGGGIHYVGGTHTLNTSIVTNNTVGSGGGGVFLLDTTVTLNDSIVSSNYGFNSGGGIYTTNTTLNLVRSSVFANSAAFGGGLNTDGTTTVTNSTISGNGADRGGGIQNSNGNLFLTNSTMTSNNAPDGSGLYNWPGEFVQAQNTIVANNLSGGNCAGGTMTSIGYNLSSDATCTWIGPGDIHNASPALGPLAYNGGRNTYPCATRRESGRRRGRPGMPCD